MTHSSYSRRTLVVAVLALITAISAVAGYRVTASIASMTAIRSAAIQNKAADSAQRREHQRITDRCSRATETTKDYLCQAYLLVQKECMETRSATLQMGCPRVSDLARIRTVQSALENKEAVSSASSSSSLRPAAGSVSVDTLSLSERAMLRQGLWSKKCLPELPFEVRSLCEQMIGR